MADVERTGGIGADELHLDPPPLTQIRRSVPLPLPFHLLEQAGQDTLTDEEIHEPRAGDLHPLEDSLGVLDPLRKDPRDFAGVLPGLRGENHGDVGGVVAVGRIFRPLHLDGRPRNTGQQPRLAPRADRPFEQFDQLLFHENSFLHTKRVGREANPLPSPGKPFAPIKGFPFSGPFRSVLSFAALTGPTGRQSAWLSPGANPHGRPVRLRRCPCP